MFKKIYNTFNLEVYTQFYTEIKSVKDALKAAHEIEFPFEFIGGGSNVLFLNQPSGTVIFNQIQGIEVLEDSKENVVVKVGGGMNWSEWVDYTMEKDWGGLENLSLIPGTVGASPIQNIGAYGTSLEDFFHSLEGVHWETKKLMVFNKEDCQFGYRTSIFKQEKFKDIFFITHVIFKLSKPGYHKIQLSYPALQSYLEEKGTENPTIQQVSQAVKEIRKSKLPDPAVVGNAGSFFKNPIISKQHFEQLKKEFDNMPFFPEKNGDVKIPAAWLIEKAGWKGKTIGQVGTHPLQPLVIINKGKATGVEVSNFYQKLQQVILDQFGIYLEPEVNLIY